MEKDILNKLLSKMQNRDSHKLSRPPDADDNVSCGMLLILQRMRDVGYPIRGFTRGEPPRTLPTIRKIPFSDEYDIWMQTHPSDICKRNFSIAILAILEGREFIEGDFSKYLSFDELFAEHKNLQIPFNQFLSFF